MYLSRTSEHRVVFLLVVLTVSLLHAAAVWWTFAYEEEITLPRKRPHLVARTVQLQEKKEPAPVSIPKAEETIQPPEAPPAPPPSVEIVPPKPPEAAPVKKDEVAKPVQKEVAPPAPPPPKKETIKKTVNKTLEKPKEKPKEQAPKKPPQEKKKEAKKTDAAPSPSLEEKAAVEKARQEKIKQQELLQKAQARLSNIKDARITSTTPSAPPTASAIDNLHIDALPLDHSKEWSVQEIRYQDELAGRLKLLLKLPEAGDVKLKLTLGRSGKVEKVEILNSQSEANRKYASEKLPTLTFPGFGMQFGTASSYAFTILLQSEL